MNYKLVKKNPYQHQKISLWKTFQSTLSTVLVFGMVVTITGHIKHEWLINQANLEYKESIIAYHHLIKATARIFQELEIENPNDCFITYTKLLWNGFFSSNGSYYYQKNNEINLTGNLGMKLTTGNGDCKNNEDFFCKLMQELGYESYQVTGTLIDNISISDFLYPNHVITVVYDQDNTYYFDTTNFCSYQKQSFNYLVNKQNNIHMILRPISSYQYGYNDISKVKEIYERECKSNSIEGIVTDSNIENYKILDLKQRIKPYVDTIYQLMEE